MEGESQRQTQEALVQNDVELEEHGEAGDEEAEVEKLQAEVNEMAGILLNYRSTIPDQLKSTLSSVLAAQRPILPTHFVSGSESLPGSSNELNPDLVTPIGSSKGASLAGEDQENEKIRLLKQKISRNVATLPIVLKRMKDCMGRINNLESYKGMIIHPAFKRKRTS